MKLFALLFIISVTLLIVLFLRGRQQTLATLQSCKPSGLFKEIHLDSGRSVNIHYIDEGQGPSVVFLHGASSNLEDWRLSVIPELKKSFRVIALDRPGLGFSSRSHFSGSPLTFQTQVIHQFLQELGVHKPIIVGHSLSGVIAARLTAEYNSFYAGLMLVAGAVYPIGNGKSWYTVGATLPLLGPLFRHLLIAPLGPTLAPSLVEKNFSPNPVPDNYENLSCLKLLFEPQRFLYNAQDLNQVRLYLDESYLQYHKITQPVSMIYGANDQTIYADVHSQGFLAKVPHAQLHFLDKVGHLPQHSQKELVIRELQRLATEI